jgi:hypothetical protein
MSIKQLQFARSNQRKQTRYGGSMRTYYYYRENSAYKFKEDIQCSLLKPENERLNKKN